MKKYKSVYQKVYPVSYTNSDYNKKLKINALSVFLQETAGLHAIHLDIGFEEMIEKNQIWVLNRLKIEIDEYPKWGTEVCIKTWVHNYKRGMSQRNFGIFQNENLLAKAASTWIVIGSNTRKPENLILNHSHIEIKNKKDFIDSPKRIRHKDSLIFRYENTVKIGDIDFANHVNNTKYIEWALNAIPKQKFDVFQIKELEINFNKELIYTDNYEVYSNENQTIIEITKDKETYFACKIKWNS